MKTKKGEQLVIVKTFDNSFEANVAKGKLSENGIESFLEEENVMGLNPLGGTELKVFLKDLENASNILAK